MEVLDESQRRSRLSSSIDKSKKPDIYDNSWMTPVTFPKNTEVTRIPPSNIFAPSSPYTPYQPATSTGLKINQGPTNLTTLDPSKNTISFSFNSIGGSTDLNKFNTDFTKINPSSNNFGTISPVRQNTLDFTKPSYLDTGIGGTGGSFGK